jgi:hypothetical protein
MKFDFHAQFTVCDAHTYAGILVCDAHTYAGIPVMHTRMRVYLLVE